MNKTKLYAAGMALIAVLATGCTAEKPQKKVLREDVLSKDLIEAVDTQDTSSLRARADRIVSTGTKYMFLASVSTSDRKTGATFPYYQGEENMVKFEWTKNSLRVLNVERDPRFADNNVNFKPVLEIPVDHVDYKCSEDAYGDCTSKEEENKEIDSLRRGFFKPKISDTEVQMLTGVPLLGPSGGNTGCATETSSRLVGYDFSKDAINIEIERTFLTKLTWNCISSLVQSWESLSDLSFTTRHYFSIVKLDHLKTKDYRPIVYSETEENLFGFFKNEEITLDIDGNDTVDSKKMFLNRWAPNRVVNYYLSPKFNDPRYKVIKQATYEGVDVINESLKKAGAKLRLKLNEPVKDMAPGDLRYNMLVLVDEPMGFGILGYGPSAKNPESGEILKANTNMYLGTMAKGIRRDYDQIVKDKLAEASLLMKRPALTLDPALEKRVFRARPDQNKIVEAVTQITTASDASTRLPQNIEPIRGSIAQNSRKFLAAQGHSHVAAKDIEKLIGKAVNPTNYSDETADFNAEIERLSRENIYHEDMFNFNSAISQGMEKVIEQMGLRLWKDLNDGERAEVIEKLLPYVWVPTLIHEIGHNLGLRHNFGASEDKENFYTDEELKKMGVTENWTYSSVMDYGYRSTNELRVMGK